MDLKEPVKTESGGISSFGNIAPAANTQFPRDWIVEMAEHWLDESEKRIQLEGRAQPVGFFYFGTGRVGSFGRRVSSRLGTAGLRPQTRAQAGVAPLLRNGLGYSQKVWVSGRVGTGIGKNLKAKSTYIYI